MARSGSIVPLIFKNLFVKSKIFLFDERLIFTTNRGVKLMIERIPFNRVFTKNESTNTFTPTRRININGISFGPGVSFGNGVIFGGVDVHQLEGKDLAIEEQAGVWIIKGFYQ